MRHRILGGVLAGALLAFTSGCAARKFHDSHGPWITHASGKQGPAHWFMNQRRSADPALPLKALGHAVDKLRSQPESLAPGAWINVGPTNVGGRVTAIGVDPNNANHLWLGTAAGGVWSSSDNGVNWTPRFDAETALSIGSLAVHPTNSSVAYVGTGEDNGGGFSYDGEGVFRTDDGGATWTDLGLAETRRIGRILVDPANPQRVLVAAGGDWFHKDANRGVYRSTDAGATWQRVLYVADDAGAVDLARHPSNPSRVFAAVWQRFSAGASWYIGGPSSGIWRSLDSGATWTKLSAGLPAAPGRIGLAIAPSNPNTIYACIINDQGGLDGVYRSIDGGDTWVKQSGASVPGQFSSFSYYFSQIRVDPANANTVIALDVNLLRSTNGGASFASIAASVHVDWHELLVEAGGRWLAGTDGGFYRSVDNGSTFFKPTTLPITQFYDLGIAATDGAIRFAGAQDNFTQRTTTGGGSDWVSVLGGDGLQCEVDSTNPSIVYAEYQFGGINRSTNGGASFTNATTGISGTDRKNWNTPIRLDPVVPATLYTATQRVYRSVNGAVSWSPISADLTNGPTLDHAHDHGGVIITEEDTPPQGQDEDGIPTSHLQNLIEGTISALGISTVDPQILWAGTDDGNVWVSDNGGGTWTKVNPAGPAYWVTDIEPSRFDSRSAYLSVTGYRQGNKLPYVRVTRNLGATWQDLSAGLPQLPVNALLPSREWRGRLFAANDIGVFVSDNDGLAWSELRGGMPYVVVMDLVEHALTHTLFAASHARSIFTFDLNQLPAADGDGDGVDNNADCALADPGAFAVPGEVASLLVDAGPQLQALAPDPAVNLTWSSQATQAGAGTRYDVAAGTLSSLAVSGTADAAALACAQTGTLYTDSTDAPAGDGFYYLVRARNACGLGSWGAGSSGIPRPVTACP